jgi:hypothetical protein
MEKIKMLTYERIPCWYELSFRKEKPAIIFRIHKDFIAHTESISQTAPIVMGFMSHFGFKKFSGSLAGNFGFDDSFIFEGIKEDFAEFAVDIPTIKKYSGKKCEECNGSGKDRFLNDECLRCEGTGKDWFYDWKLASAISASFTTILLWMRFPEKETSSLLPQLMTVFTVTEDEMHGGSLGGAYSVELCNWMRSLYVQNKGRYEVAEMTEAMKIVHKKMFGALRFGQEHDLWAKIENDSGWLNVNCPGDACGLHPGDSYGPQKKRGYEFACHNVDNPMQQITLLAGLAALHNKARREIKS